MLFTSKISTTKVLENFHVLHDKGGNANGRCPLRIILGKTHKSIFSRKASFGRLGGGRFCRWTLFKKSVKNRFLTKQMFFNLVVFLSL